MLVIKDVSACKFDTYIIWDFWTCKLQWIDQQKIKTIILHLKFFSKSSNLNPKIMNFQALKYENRKIGFENYACNLRCQSLQARYLHNLSFWTCKLQWIDHQQKIKTIIVLLKLFSKIMNSQALKSQNPLNMVWKLRL